jgi:hypothetical protein
MPHGVRSFGKVAAATVGAAGARATDVGSVVEVGAVGVAGVTVMASGAAGVAAGAGAAGAAGAAGGVVCAMLKVGCIRPSVRVRARVKRMFVLLFLKTLSVPFRAALRDDEAQLRHSAGQNDQFRKTYSSLYLAENRNRRRQGDLPVFKIAAALWKHSNIQ